MTIGHGQTTFQKTFGTPVNEITQKLIQTFDNGYCILGTSGGFISLNKIDSTGNILWAKQYSIHCNTTQESNHFATFDQTKDKGYIICSVSDSTFANNYGYLLKTDSLGNILWCKTYDSVKVFNSVKETFDGGYIAAGQRISYLGNLIPIIQKTDSLGQVQWVRTLHTSNYNYSGYDVIQLKVDSSYAMISYGPATSALLFTKFNKIGINTCAVAFFGGGLCDNALKLVENQSGKIDISGSFGGAFALIEIDTSGNVIWGKEFSFGSKATDFFISKNKGFLISCFYDYNSYLYYNFFHINLIKTDSLGQVQWSKRIGGMRYDYSNTIFENQNSEIIIGGTTQNFNTGYFDYYLIKLDSFTNQTCNDTSAFLQSNPFPLSPQLGWGQTIGTPNHYVSPQTVSSMNISLNNYDACGCISPVAGFSTPIQNGYAYEFHDSSTWVSNWYWDFGDGTVDSININTFHQYLDSGIYNVCLIVKNACGSDTFCRQQFYYGYNTVSIVELNKDDFSCIVYPNPFSYLTTLHTNKPLINATLNIFNSFGQKVKQIKNISGQTFTLHRDNLQSGLYFLQMTQENKIVATGKLVITD